MALPLSLPHSSLSQEEHVDPDEPTEEMVEHRQVGVEAKERQLKGQGSRLGLLGKAPWRRGPCTCLSSSLAVP